MNKLSHADEYKALRDEMLQHIQQIYRTETYAAVAVSGCYTWLILQKHNSVSLPFVIWLIPPTILLLSSLRCLHLVRNMEIIGRYLTLIEKDAFNDSKVPGWERFKTDKTNRFLDQQSNILAGGIWVLAIATSIILSLTLSK
jgi:hypothetical protein